MPSSLEFCYVNSDVNVTSRAPMAWIDDEYLFYDRCLGGRREVGAYFRSAYTVSLCKGNLQTRHVDLRTNLNCSLVLHVLDRLGGLIALVHD